MSATMNVFMRRAHCGKNLLQPLLISRLALPAILTVACYFPLHAHGNHKHAAQSPIPVSRAIDTTPRALADTGIMGMEEKPGAQIPLDCRFVTETGDSVSLRDVVKGPTILSILYYSCPDACNTLVMGIANAVGPYSDKPALAPNVLCVSVDDHETPADAMKEKNIAFESMQRRYPQDRWRFLTGDAENIRKLTGAVGFHFVKKGNEFDHPLGIIILSPEGKVTRYILGTDYLPMDISLSLMQASKGVVQPTVARVLRACFSYDPKSHRFVFNILRVSATVVFSLIGLFILYLVLSGRKRRAKGSP
jgi:protein SCO1/2